MNSTKEKAWIAKHFLSEGKAWIEKHFRSVHASHDLDGSAHPLYRLYAGQIEPQDAYIYLDTTRLEMWAQFDESVGNQTREEYMDPLAHDGARAAMVCWRIDPLLTAEEVNRLMSKIEEDCCKYMAAAGASEEEFVAWTRVEDACTGEKTKSMGVWDCAAYFEGVDPKPKTTDEVERMVRENTTGPITLLNIDEFMKAVREGWDLK